MAIKLPRGTTYNYKVVYKKNGIAATLVGATIFFTAKAVEFDNDLTDASAVILKTITTHTDAVNGLSTVILTPSDSLNLSPTIEYSYDCKVKEAGGDIYKLDEGKLVIDGSPTNRLA